jgi:hypothetical protein
VKGIQYCEDVEQGERDAIQDCENRGIDWAVHTAQSMSQDAVVPGYVVGYWRGIRKASKPDV